MSLPLIFPASVSSLAGARGTGCFFSPAGSELAGGMAGVAVLPLAFSVTTPLGDGTCTTRPEFSLLKRLANEPFPQGVAAFDSGTAMAGVLVSLTGNSSAESDGEVLFSGEVTRPDEIVEGKSLLFSHGD